jgi:acyl carrier protein phosphodiesterase
MFGALGSPRSTRQVRLNFFAHAVVASRRSHAPRFVLGAMLPDLVSMIGVRVQHADDAELSRGIELHHATDSTFHAAPAFTALCSSSISGLCEQGVGRGTARAVAHVGVELLLDGALSGDAPERALYAAALAAAADGGLDQLLTLAPPHGLPRLSAGLARLASSELPEAYRDPAFVVDRLRVILARRPRLAMAEGDYDKVAEWAEAIQPSVLACSRELLEHVVSHTA